MTSRKVLKFLLTGGAVYFLAIAVAHFGGWKIPALYVYYNVPSTHYQDVAISFLAFGWSAIFWAASRNLSICWAPVLISFVGWCGLAWINLTTDFSALMPEPTVGKYWLQTWVLFLYMASIAASASIARIPWRIPLSDGGARRRVQFLEALAKVDLIIQEAHDLDELMSDTAQAVLEIFECDRAWMLFPADYDSPSWRLPVIRTTPEYSHTELEGEELPKRPEGRVVGQLTMGSEGPVGFGPGNEHDLFPYHVEEYQIQSMLMCGVRPKKGKDWVLGVHHCRGTRVWTSEERKLFKEIAYRLSGALNSMLFLQELHHSEERFREVLDGSLDIIYQLNLETGKYDYMSPAVEKMTGFSARQFMEGGFEFSLSRLHPDDAPGLAEHISDVQQAMLKPGVLPPISYRWLHTDGSYHWFWDNRVAIGDGSGKAVRIVGSSRDVTEQRDLEDQLRESQKMEVIGQFAGGIAHDFNNLLQAIQGFSELALTEVEQPQAVQGRIERILEASDKASVLVKQVLAFGRRQVLDMRSLNFNQTLANMLEMIQGGLEESIELRTDFADGLPNIVADGGQLEQIVMNLCLNARDAMPSGGKLTLETRLSADGGFVALSVIDNGRGISEDVRSKIFEPFFTTKEAGRGTGLGLSMVYGLVRQHDGQIEVRSVPGQGTTFRVFLPVTEHHPDHPVDSASTPSADGKGRRVLVVDDNLAVRTVAEAMLEDCGYAVQSAANGEEAWATLNELDNPIDLVLCDVVMPKLGGRELFEKVQSVRPDTRFLFTSGYSPKEIHASFILESGLHFLQKPYRRDSLLNAVQLALA